MTQLLVLAIVYFSIGAYMEWYSYHDRLRRGYSRRKARIVGVLAGFFWLPLFAWYKLENPDG